MAGMLQRGQRVDEAGRQPAEAAVAEPGVRLLLERARSSPTAGRSTASPHERLEPQVDDVVGQRAADQELHRQVVDPLRVLALVGLPRSRSQRWESRSRTERATASKRSRGRPLRGRRRSRTPGGARRARCRSRRTRSDRTRTVASARWRRRPSRMRWSPPFVASLPYLVAGLVARSHHDEAFVRQQDAYPIVAQRAGSLARSRSRWNSVWPAASSRLREIASAGLLVLGKAVVGRAPERSTTVGSPCGSRRQRPWSSGTTPAVGRRGEDCST